MHDCFTIELTGECLKCLFRLTGGVLAVVVQSEALWARIPEIQVRIPSRAMGTFFPHTVSSIFRLSLTHTHTHTHTLFSSNNNTRTAYRNTVRYSPILLRLRGCCCSCCSSGTADRFSASGLWRQRCAINKRLVDHTEADFLLKVNEEVSAALLRGVFPDPQLILFVAGYRQSRWCQ